jgi:hypothetical protein
VKLRKPLTDSIGDLDPTKSQAEITTRATSLANAIIAARAQAKTRRHLHPRNRDGPGER